MNDPARALSILCILALGLGSSFGKGDNRRTEIDEYSGKRGEHEVMAAFASKCFTWLSGSPADNEVLSIGKNAQYFGLVALRYQSGRSANRGVLGRSVFSIATQEQQEHLSKAVLAQEDALEQWWETRNEILRVLENHLYTHEPINREALAPLAREFGRSGTEIALHEARAYAAFEDLMDSGQREQLMSWRQDPELAMQSASGVRVFHPQLAPDQGKQLENLYAKCFSWLTGEASDNEVIPLGQPAQFFGFVAIRHKSGHAASRGQISKAFLGMLSNKQVGVFHEISDQHGTLVEQFMKERKKLLELLATLRSNPDAFREGRVIAVGERLGVLEVEIAALEAEAYHQIRKGMDETQLASMMDLRGEYILDQTQIEGLSHLERGQALAMLCSGCHGASSQSANLRIGPTLEDLFSRPIAAVDGYDYSEALKTVSLSHTQWTTDLLDAFLASPKKFAPGTRMEFQGLLKQEDRRALIDYLAAGRELPNPLQP